MCKISPTARNASSSVARGFLKWSWQRIDQNDKMQPWKLCDLSVYFTNKPCRILSGLWSSAELDLVAAQNEDQLGIPAELNVIFLSFLFFNDWPAVVSDHRPTPGRHLPRMLWQLFDQIPDRRQPDLQMKLSGKDAGFLSHLSSQDSHRVSEQDSETVWTSVFVSKRPLCAVPHEMHTRRRIFLLTES